MSLLNMQLFDNRILINVMMYTCTRLPVSIHSDLTLCSDLMILATPLLSPNHSLFYHLFISRHFYCMILKVILSLGNFPLEKEIK